MDHGDCSHFLFISDGPDGGESSYRRKQGFIFSGHLPSYNLGEHWSEESDAELTHLSKAIPLNGMMILITSLVLKAINLFSIDMMVQVAELTWTICVMQWWRRWVQVDCPWRFCPPVRGLSFFFFFFFFFPLTSAMPCFSATGQPFLLSLGYQALPGRVVQHLLDPSIFFHSLPVEVRNWNANRRTGFDGGSLPSLLP